MENTDMKQMADTISRGDLSDYKYSYLDDKDILTAKSNKHSCSNGLFYMEISEDGLLYSTLQEDEQSYLLANTFANNHIYSFTRNMGIALTPIQLKEKLALLIKTFGSGLVYNIENAYFIERDNEIWFECQDEDTCGGLGVTIDGRLIYGMEGGHSLCNGLFREYFDIYNGNAPIDFTKSNSKEYKIEKNGAIFRKGFFSEAEAKTLAELLGEEYIVSIV